MADQEFELTTPPLKPPLQNTSAPRDQEPDAADLEKLKKWHEERMARKLKGEYETAVFHLAELVRANEPRRCNKHSDFVQVNDNLQSPARIAAIRVEGATHTRRSFLSSLVHPYLSSSAESPQTLEGVLHTTRQFGHVLNETDIFQHVSARLEASRDVYAKTGDVDVVFKAKEKGRLYLSTSTEVGNNEGGAVCLFLCLRIPLLNKICIHRARPVAFATPLVVQRPSKPTSLLLPQPAFPSTRRSLLRSPTPSKRAARYHYSVWRETTRSSQAIPRVYEG